jgi:large subunit ribosomal protein L6
MSRLGKRPVKIIEGVQMEVTGKTVKVTGPKGSLDLKLPYTISVKVENGEALVERKNDSKQARSDHGTIRAILLNLIKGVTEGYKKELELMGMGYRARVEGKKLIMNLGFTNPVEVALPDDITVSVRDDVVIEITGIDNQRVGLWASKIRSIRKPEPYKGKGIKYIDEVIRRKTTKSMKEE